MQAGIAGFQGKLAQTGTLSQAALGQAGASARQAAAQARPLGAAFAAAAEGVRAAVDGIAAAVTHMGSDASRGLQVQVIKSILRWGAAITTFAAVLKIIPMVISAFKAVKAALTGVNIALAIKNALSGPEGWKNLATGAAAAVAALAVFIGIGEAAETLSKKLGEDKYGIDGSKTAGLRGDRSTALPKTGGFEDLRAAYQRIAVAAMRASAGLKDPQREMVEEQKRANEHLRRIDEHTGNLRPLLAR